MMKRYFLSLVAFIAATMAFSQEEQVECVPTQLKNENLKGKVLAVRYDQYLCKENFGEPTLGTLVTTNVTIYDEEGRSYLYRSMEERHGYLYVWYNYFKYEEGEPLKVTRTSYSITCSADPLRDQFHKAIFSYDNSYDSLMVANSGQYGICREHGAEIVYDKDEVPVSYTVKQGDEILVKMVGKPAGTAGLYKFTLYDERGNRIRESSRTYQNGLLVKEDNQNYMNLRGNYPLDFEEAGTYAYNPTNRQLTYQYIDRLTKEMTFERNAQGDVVKVIGRVKEYTVSGTKDKWRAPFTDGYYDEYQYDDHGNWVYRAYHSGDNTIPQYYERREILYFPETDN